MSDLFASLPHNWFVAWPLWKQSVTMAAAVLVFIGIPYRDRPLAAQDKGFL